MESTAYFVRTGEGSFRATARTAGAWSPADEHISPMTGLLVHEMERAVGEDGNVLARLSLDILGVIEVEEFEVGVEVVRPGRTISLVEARVTGAGRTVATARAWRLQPSDTEEVADGACSPLPPPDELPRWDMTTVWPGGYIASLEVRRHPDAEPGRAVAWVRSDVGLLADEPVSGLAHWAAFLDTANGLSVRRSPQEWLFPNVDLTVHLHRLPKGPWVGFDTRVVFGPRGVGLTDTVLHDVYGPVGRAEQALTVRRRPS